MGRIARYFGNPGSRPDIHQRAPICVYDDTACDQNPKCSFEENTSIVSSSDESTENLGTVHVDKSGAIETSRGFTGLDKGKTDRALDKLVYIAGSQFVFFFMWIIIIVWAVVGIVYRAPNNWQVVMQDGQSIQSYVWDTLLMRQQLISAHEQTVICGVLRSRIANYKKLLQKKLSEKKIEETVKKDDARMVDTQLSDLDITPDLPVEVWYDKLSSFASFIIGSLPSMIIFWLGIIIWIVCGVIPTSSGNTPPYTGETTGSNPRLQKFSSTWQLYINSATAVVLLVCTIFLQNIRARHDKYISKFVVDIFDADSQIESKVRIACDDKNTVNPVVTIPAKKRSFFEKIIDFYADIIGTGAGVAIAIIAIGAWIAVGHLLNWSDNWWLIIGTYTGLIGFLDGFVIRQVYYRIVNHEEENYEIVAEEELELFELLGIECPEEYNGRAPALKKRSIDYRISVWINFICSSQWSVLCSIVVIVGLICAACGLHWTTTGQLLCNTPTMIIEAFFMIVLIQAHNWADYQRRVEFTALLARRRILLLHLERAFSGTQESKSTVQEVTFDTQESTFTAISESVSS